MRERIAHAQAGEPVRLGERARDDEVGMALEPFHGVGAQVRAEVLVVGLVDHDQHALGHLAHERLQRLRLGERSGRIVRVRDPQHVGLVVDRFRHRVQIVAVALRRHHDRARAARLGGEGVDGERVLRHHRGAARPEEGERDQLEHVVRAVAQDDGRQLDAVAPGERELQLVAVAVGVARDLADRRFDRRARARPDAERVLVRGELDDRLLVEAHLARKLRDRLARLVRRDRAHVGGRELAGIHQHGQFTATG